MVRKADGLLSELGGAVHKLRNPGKSIQKGELRVSVEMGKHLG